MVLSVCATHSAHAYPRPRTPRTHASHASHARTLARSHALTHARAPRARRLMLRIQSINLPGFPGLMSVLGTCRRAPCRLHARCAMPVARERMDRSMVKLGTFAWHAYRILVDACVGTSPGLSRDACAQRCVQRHVCCTEARVRRHLHRHVCADMCRDVCTEISRTETCPQGHRYIVIAINV